MYRILKLDQSYCYVGNIKNKTISKIPLANGYETMAVGDEVELFYAQEEMFVFKSEKIRPVFTQPIKDRTSSNTVKKPIIESPEFLSIFKQNVLNILMSKSLWISVVSFMAVLFVFGFVLSYIVNEYFIEDFTKNNILYYLESVDGLNIGGLRVNTVVATLFLMMSELKMVFQVPFLSETPIVSLSGFHPVFLGSFILISIGLWVARLVSLSLFKQMNSWNKLMFLNFVSIISFSLLGIFGNMYRFSVVNGLLVIRFSTWPMVWRGILVVFLLSCLLVKLDHSSSLVNQLLYTLRSLSRKLRIVLLGGMLVGAALIYSFEFDYVNQRYLTLATYANFSTMIPYSLGSEDFEFVLTSYYDNTLEGVETYKVYDQLKESQVPVGLFGSFFLMIFALFMWFVDADEYVYKKNNATLFASAISVGFVAAITVWLVANLAVINYSPFIDGSGGFAELIIGKNGILHIAFILSVLTLARFYLGNQFAPLNYIKKVFSKFRVV